MDMQNVVRITQGSPGRPGRWFRSRLEGRQPVRIGERHVRVGTRAVDFDPLDATSLLEAYLRLVRRARRQQSAPDVTLRRDDIEIIAEHLASTPEVVIDRLASLMGATRAQRVAMASLFASGAMVIGLVGTAAAEAPAASAGLPARHPLSATIAAPRPSATNTGDDTLPLVLWDGSSHVEEREGGVDATAGDPPLDDTVEPVVDTDLDPAPPADETVVPDDGEPAIVEVGLPPVPPAIGA